jgi:hypothetical protein
MPASPPLVDPSLCTMAALSLLPNAPFARVHSVRTQMSVFAQPRAALSTQLLSARAWIGSTEYGPPPAALSADFRITRTRRLTLTATSLHFRLCSISSRRGSPSSWHKVSSPSIAVSHQDGPVFGHHAFIGQHGPAGCEHLGSSHWTAFGQLALGNIWPAASEHLGSSHWTAFGQLALDSIWSASIGQHFGHYTFIGQLTLTCDWSASIALPSVDQHW